MAAQPKRIVVGFDGTERACKALDAAAQLMGYGSTMTVVACVVRERTTREIHSTLRAMSSSSVS